MILSKNNAKVVEFKRLCREKTFFLLDTPKLVSEAIDCGLVAKMCLVANESKFSNLLCKIDCEKITVSDEVLKSVCNVTSPSGIAVVFEQKKWQMPSKLNRFLVLCKVQDPGNVGTLVRSALGAGFECIIAIESALPTNAKVVRSAMGALFRLPYFCMSEKEFEDFAKHKKLNLVCADMNGENVFGTSFEKNCGLVVGSEGQGVLPEIRKLCNKVVSIPMQGGLESLNVGASGSIIMYQITKGELL